MDVRQLRDHLAASAPDENRSAPAKLDAAFDPSNFGTVVRNLRMERGWTLRELAKRSNISQSALSRLETGQSALSFDRAHALAQALGVDAMTFVRQMGWPQGATETSSGFHGWRSLTPAGMGQHVDQANAKYEYVCNDFLYRKLVAGFVEVTARSLAEHGPMVSHPGEEFTYVIEGPVTFSTPGFADVTLNTGDCFQFDSATPHAWFSGGDKPARVLFMTTDPRAE
jgi:DNA-binding XRE family transcriptional regulator